MPAWPRAGPLACLPAAYRAEAEGLQPVRARGRAAPGRASSRLGGCRPAPGTSRAAYGARSVPASRHRACPVAGLRGRGLLLWRPCCGLVPAGTRLAASATRRVAVAQPWARPAVHGWPAPGRLPAVPAAPGQLASRPGHTRWAAVLPAGSGMPAWPRAGPLACLPAAYRAEAAGLQPVRARGRAAPVRASSRHGGAGRLLVRTGSHAGAQRAG